MLVEQFSLPSTSIYLPDTQSEVTGNSTYSTFIHQSLEKCSISEHSSDSRSECFSLLGCQRQPCEQQARGLKTDSLAAEDFTMPGFLNFSHPLWFPPLEFQFIPSLEEKKRRVGVEKFYMKYISKRWKTGLFPQWHQILYFNSAEGWPPVKIHLTALLKLTN